MFATGKCQSPSAKLQGILKTQMSNAEHRTLNVEWLIVLNRLEAEFVWNLELPGDFVFHWRKTIITV